MIVKIWLLIIAIATAPAWAQRGGAGSSGPSMPGSFQMAAMAMVLTSSTKQGGQGPQGSTILTHSEIQYNKDWWGVGLYFQYDKHGDSQTDTGLGPKVELTWSPFFLEIGYTFMVSRGFTDRSIAKQTGNGLIIAPGVRFKLNMGQGGGGGAAGGGGMFFEASYKYRTQKLTKQDSTALSEPIEQTDGYPVFGLGYKF